MDVWNQKILGANEDALKTRLKLHWGIAPQKAGDCSTCGACESACTQHLDITTRLKEIARIKM
jgi:predicted aldo/keto reductase-like oxidoreductase